MGPLAVVGYWVVYGAAWAGLRQEREGGTPHRLDVAGVLLWCLVAIPTTLQLTVAPGLLAAGRRDPQLIADGEVWRLVTAIVLQDGGWWGAVTNLVTLAITLLLARAILGGWATAGALLGGGVLANVLTAVVLGQTGAGSSMATMFLAVVALLTARRGRGAAALVPAGLVVAATATLLLLRDQHGLAAAAGLLVGGVPVVLSPRAGSRA